MGSEMMYAVVLGLLGLLGTALVANATGLAPLAGARLRLAKIVGDAKGFAQQQAAFRASKQDVSKELRNLLVEDQRIWRRTPTPSSRTAPS